MARIKNTSMYLTSPSVRNGVCPEGLMWEVSIYSPAEPCAVSFKIIIGRTICRIIYNRLFTKATAANCPQIARSVVLSRSWAFKELQSVSSPLAEDSRTQILFSEGRWTPQPTRERMSSILASRSHWAKQCEGLQTLWIFMGVCYKAKASR